MKPKVHPLNLLSAEEIEQASAILKGIIQKQQPGAKIWIKNVSLEEPPKALLLPYLDAEADGVSIEQRPFVPRFIGIIHSSENERKVTHSVVDIDAQAIVSESHPQRGQHSSNDRVEMVEVSKKILAHQDVVAAVAKLQLPAGVTVQCDPWMYGADRDSDEDTHKLIQAYLYARAPHNHPDSNQYAWPLPISALWDLFEDRLIEIVNMPTGGTEDGLKGGTAPVGQEMAHCVENEYLPELQKGGLRTDLKPLLVHQPEGPSFTVKEGNWVHWQKWSFRVGFNYREGLFIHNVRYDGRKVFYRLSISEMTVPYGDPRSSYHRKQAFDLGDAGAGSTANNLSLGCDCLGSIYYFSAYLNDNEGRATDMPNVICMHEVDNGIGWKHTNMRTGRAAVTRQRNLVLQSILTVGNYEYIFAWNFLQTGALEVETRATGILSTSLIDAGKTSAYGNVVSPGVLAANHQHLFSLRVDPMVDGPQNTVVQEDSVPLPTDEATNPFGNAWEVVRTPFATARFADASPQDNRCFKIINEAHRNPVSGRPVGYKIVPHPTQLILARPGSVTRARATYATHHVWVSAYRDGDLWAGGPWTNQSLKEIGGVADYVARGEPVRNADLVFWLTYGLTHNPRVEDFPVMPVETLRLELQPTDFFDRNPALDVPPSTQAVNRSVLVGETGGSCCVPSSKL